MTPTWLNVLLPIVTLVIGAVGTTLNERWRDDRTARRAAESRSAERDALLADERRRFEIDTLKGAHAAIVQMVDAILDAAMNEDDIPAQRRSTLNTLSAQAAIGLILDEDVRLKTQAAFDELSKMDRADTRDEANPGGLIAEAAHAIGENVRAVYLERSDKAE